MEDKCVCPCGLTCCDCLFYKRGFFDAAKMIKRLIDLYRFDVFFSTLSKPEANAHIAAHLGRDKTELATMFRAFEHMPEFVEVLEGLISVQCEHTCNEKNGCSIGGATHQCEALVCVNGKGIEGCWQCQDYKTCEKLAFQRKGYGETVTENLVLLDTEGATAVRSRGNQYYEWQRKITQAKATHDSTRLPNQEVHGTQ